MRSLLRPLAAMLLFLSAASVGNAASVTTHTLTKLFGSTAGAGTKVTDIAADSANKVWFTTNTVGVTALVNTSEAPGFPLYSTLTGAGFTTSLSSVAFGPVGQDKQENFFLGANGSASGILYGRMLDNGPSFANDRTLNDELMTAHGTTKVNALAADGDTRLWIATDKGVTSASLPGLAISSTLLEPNSADTNVVTLVDANPILSGGEGFFATSTRFYMINPSSPNGWLYFTYSANLNGIGGLSVDPTGNLWVVETSGVSKIRRVLKYDAFDLDDWSGGVSGEPDPLVYEFDPGAIGSAYTDARSVNVIKVSPSSGEVWLGTTKGAFFQKPDIAGNMSSKLCQTGQDWESLLDDVDGNGAACVDDGSGWKPVPQSATETSLAVNENFSAIYLDSLGNAWLGSDRTIRVVLTRNLTLSGTRFIGTGARATVLLYDENLTDPPNQAVVNVKVGGSTADLPMTEVAPGQYKVTFGFTTSADSDPIPSPHLFTVDSASENTILVTYTFTDSQGQSHDIILPATWVEIAPFEDDLWVGGGCLIRAMNR